MTFGVEFGGRRPDPVWRATAALTLVARGLVQLHGDNQWTLTRQHSLIRDRLIPWCDTIQDELDNAFDSRLIALPTTQMGVAQLTDTGKYTLSCHLHRALELTPA
jgi:hypothetical protein